MTHAPDPHRQSCPAAPPPPDTKPISVLMSDTAAHGKLLASSVGGGGESRHPSASRITSSRRSPAKSALDPWKSVPLPSTDCAVAFTASRMRAAMSHRVQHQSHSALPVGVYVGGMSANTPGSVLKGLTVSMSQAKLEAHAASAWSRV